MVELTMSDSNKEKEFLDAIEFRSKKDITELIALKCNLSKKNILLYEIASSFWTRWASLKCLQNIAASYFVWKVNRKWKKFLARVEWKEE